MATWRQRKNGDKRSRISTCRRIFFISKHEPDYGPSMDVFSTEHARSCLAELGFFAEDIPVAPPAVRADLRVVHGDEEYVIEAKERQPHGGWHILRAEAAAKRVATITRDIEPWSALRPLIREGNEQLLATPASKNAFRILWIVAAHGDAEFVLACFAKRLLGTECLSVFRGLDVPFQMLDCFHYSPNSFEQCRQLDAAVLATMDGGQLVLNPYSLAREKLRQGALYAKFASQNAVIDPELRVARGEALMIGEGFTGARDGKRQYEYLLDRYGARTSLAFDSFFSGLASVPTETATSPQ